MSARGVAGCPLCHPAGETRLWSDASCRVVLAGDAEYPGFCRVIWSTHVREMTDLEAVARDRFFGVVMAVEAALRAVLSPHKVNLASLGNQVPHLHWHVIPRFADDPHFPDPVWAPRRRTGTPYDVGVATLRDELAHRLRA